MARKKCNIARTGGSRRKKKDPSKTIIEITSQCELLLKKYDFVSNQVMFVIETEANYQ